MTPDLKIHHYGPPRCPLEYNEISQDENLNKCRLFQPTFQLKSHFFTF